MFWLYHFVQSKICSWASLVDQGLRICLVVQGTQVQSLIQKDPTCCGAAKPMYHNYWACALEPTNHNYSSPAPQPLEPMHPTSRAPQEEKPPQWEAWESQLESSPCSQQLQKSPHNNKNLCGPHTNHRQWINTLKNKSSLKKIFTFKIQEST